MTLLQAEYEAQAEDRRLKSFELTLEVPSAFHQKIIGPKGKTINELRDKHDVQISLPREDRTSDKVTLHGYQANVEACAADIENLVGELKAMVTQEVRRFSS